MDTDELVKRLNEDLSSEYQSLVQYNLHVATIKGEGCRASWPSSPAT